MDEARIERLREARDLVRTEISAAFGHWATFVSPNLILEQSYLRKSGAQPLLRPKFRRQGSYVPVRVFGLGTVEARVLSRVVFEVGAAVTELNADHGDVVTKGQVLARLHATQQEAKVARAKAAVLSADVAVKKADANTARARAILAQRLEVNKRMLSDRPWLMRAGCTR